MKHPSFVILTTLMLAGCATYSQLMINADGQIYRCGAYGSGLMGIAHANQINEDCIQSMRSAGYIELEKAGVIGITLSEQSASDTVCTILKVAPGSPASSASIRPGDVLAAINKQPVRRSRDAHLLIFGFADTKIDLTIKRASDQFERSLIRAPYTQVYGTPSK